MPPSNEIYGQGRLAFIRMHLDQINTRIGSQPNSIYFSPNPSHYTDAEMEKEQLITGLIMICSASGQRRKSKLKDFQVHKKKALHSLVMG